MHHEKHPVVYPELDVPDGAAFLDQLEVEVGRSDEWQPAPNAAPFRAVVAAFNGTTFEGSGLHVCACVDDAFVGDPTPNTIMFAVMADRWGGETEQFEFVSAPQLNAAFARFRPLARAAARAVAVSCRIRYPKDARAKPLPPVTASRLNAFCRLANRSCLHPNDSRRFYRFVRHCHAHGLRLSGSRLAAEMVNRLMPEKLVRFLADRYEFGRSLLAGSDEWMD
ncbi:MAG TPA: hypothetical protein VEA69_14820 [Tepidisphaeraceae bacterium]|nr:hypothetical protein [Tepidisphaeraceae bacterium]